MEFLTSQLKARLDWCHQQRQQAVVRHEQEGWWAEEAGLLGTFLGGDQTDRARAWYPSQFERYQLGLHDGKTLLRTLYAAPCGVNIMEGLGHVPPPTQARVDRRPSQAPPPSLVEERR